MERHDVRAYQSGDDIRHMDWRATARSPKPITKIFVAERQKQSLIVVDRRNSMYFGTRQEIKAVTAARVAAILCFTAMADHAAMEGLVINSDDVQYYPAQQQTITRLIQAICAPLDARQKQSSDATAKTLNNHLHEALLNNPSITINKGTELTIISDFADVLNEDGIIPNHLAKHCDSRLIRIIDPADETLTACGTIRLCDPNLDANSGFGSTLIDTDDADIRQQYSDIMRERSLSFEKRHQQVGITCWRIYNNQDSYTQLINQ